MSLAPTVFTLAVLFLIFTLISNLLEAVGL